MQPNKDQRIDKHLRVIADIRTRWNSTYLSWQRLLALKEYIIALPSALAIHQERESKIDAARLKKIMITENEWQAICEISTLLKPFYEMTAFVSGSSYTVSGMLYPALEQMRKTLQASVVDEEEFDPNTEGDAFDGKLGFEDDPQEEENPEHMKIRKVKINTPANTDGLKEKISYALLQLFEKYVQVSSKVYL